MKMFFFLFIFYIYRNKNQKALMQALLLCPVFGMSKIDEARVSQGNLINYSDNYTEYSKTHSFPGGWIQQF